MELVFLLGLLLLSQFVGIGDEDEVSEPTAPMPEPETTTPTAGDDIIQLGNGGAFLDALGGDDEINGGTGADTIFGREGNDFLFGGDGGDLLKGGAGHDSIAGGRGDDDLRGSSGDDLMVGQEGNDRLDGGSGNDDITGNAGADTLIGGAGNDFLDGHWVAPTSGLSTESDISGVDQIRGGDGNDTIFAGEGDIVFGGAGFDAYYVDSWLNPDQLPEFRDYTAGEDILSIAVPPDVGGFLAVDVVQTPGVSGLTVTIDGAPIAQVMGNATLANFSAADVFLVSV